MISASVLYVVLACMLAEYSLSIRTRLSVEPFLRNQVLSKENLEYIFSCHLYLNNALSTLYCHTQQTGDDTMSDPSGKTCFHFALNTVCHHHMAVIPRSCRHRVSNKWQLIVVSHSSVLWPGDVICLIHKIQMKSFIV